MDTVTKWTRCPQSGQIQMLSWLPYIGYPGAVVCNSCSFGVLIRKGSDYPATSESGFNAVAGVVRTHYVIEGGFRMKYA